jgi:hypothetical protein
LELGHRRIRSDGCDLFPEGNHLAISHKRIAQAKDELAGKLCNSLWMDLQDPIVDLLAT